MALEIFANVRAARLSKPKTIQQDEAGDPCEDSEDSDSPPITPSRTRSARYRTIAIPDDSTDTTKDSDIEYQGRGKGFRPDYDGQAMLPNEENDDDDHDDDDDVKLPASRRKRSRHEDGSGVPDDDEDDVRSPIGRRKSLRRISPEHELETEPDEERELADEVDDLESNGIFLGLLLHDSC